MEEELTLRDLYGVLARYRKALVMVPIIAALVVFAASSLLPRRYAAHALMAVNVVSDVPKASDSGGLGETSAFDFDPKLLPSAAALADAYQQSAPARLSGVWRAEAADISRDFEASQNDKSGALSMSAQGSSPAQARDRARQAATDFSTYVEGVISNVLRGSLGATQRRLQVQIDSDSDLAGQLALLRKNVPVTLPGTGQSSVRDQLTQAGVDPRYAGNSDAPANPAYTLLTVRIAEAQARIASGRADLARLKSVLSDRGEQLALTRQLVQISTLGDPALPVKPEGLGPIALAVLVYLLALVVTVLGSLLHHAVRGPEPQVSAGRPVITGD